MIRSLKLVKVNNDSSSFSLDDNARNKATQVKNSEFYA